MLVVLCFWDAEAYLTDNAVQVDELTSGGFRHVHTRCVKRFIRAQQTCCVDSSCSDATPIDLCFCNFALQKAVVLTPQNGFLFKVLLSSRIVVYR